MDNKLCLSNLLYKCVYWRAFICKLVICYPERRCQDNGRQIYLWTSVQTPTEDTLKMVKSRCFISITMWLLSQVLTSFNFYVLATPCFRIKNLTTFSLFTFIHSTPQKVMGLLEYFGFLFSDFHGLTCHNYALILYLFIHSPVSGNLYVLFTCIMTCTYICICNSVFCSICNTVFNVFWNARKRNRCCFINL